MRVLSVPEMLGVWERGLAQAPVERALSLLAAACPETPPQTLAAWPVGQRDAGLLTLREWTFGARLACLANCPACAERLELSFETGDIRAAPTNAGAATDEALLAGPLQVNVAGFELVLRLPASEDLLAVAQSESAPASATEGAAAARTMLLKRCTLQAQHQGAPVAVEAWPEEVQAAAAAAMAGSDPQADVQLALTCPRCGYAWQAGFDIVAYFWSEINAWAIRLLREVHTLALAYGWREADILALSPLRRQLYLEMLSR